MSSSHQAPPLLIARDAGVVTLTLNRPHRKNAIDVALWHELASALREIASRAEDRAVVLTGAGGTFCAGGDLAGSRDGGAPPAADPRQAAVDAMIDTVNAACLALHELPKPVVAAVEGTAAGAGANLAFGCDLVLAGASARFGEVFVRRALPVDSGGSWLLPRLVGLQKAKELALLGDWVTADEACRIGLVSRVVADGRALASARDVAQRLAEAAPTAVAWIKRNLNASLASSFEQALGAEARALAECVAAPEFAAAMRAFFDRSRS